MNVDLIDLKVIPGAPGITSVEMEIENSVFFNSEVYDYFVKKTGKGKKTNRLSQNLNRKRQKKDKKRLE